MKAASRFFSALGRLMVVTALVFPASAGAAFAENGYDDAPVVTRARPADGYEDIQLGAGIDVWFSEPVFLDQGWYEISCDQSGTHKATVTADEEVPGRYLLVPHHAYDMAETCAITIFAAKVHDEDSDDPPDQMVADYVSSSFTTTGEPAQAIEEARGYIDEFLAAGTISSATADVLNVKLDAILRALEDDNPGSSACGPLQALTNYVEAQYDKGLPAEFADDFHNYLIRLTDSIMCWIEVS